MTTQMPKEARQARWVFGILAAQFIGPAVSYVVQPSMTVATLSQVNELLGGGAYVAHESSGHVWHMLAVGNVMTLGFMCALLAWDSRRWGPILPSLVFLKGFSALYSLGLGLTGNPRLFFAVFLLDGATAALMVVFGRRAAKAWARLVAEAKGPAAPGTPLQPGAGLAQPAA